MTEKKRWATPPSGKKPGRLPHQTKPLSPDSHDNPAIAAAIRDYHRCGGAHFWTVYSPYNGRYTGIIASATD